MRWARHSSTRSRPICSISTTPISDTIIHPAAPVAAPVLGIGAGARVFGAGRSHGIHSRRGSRVPRRQRRVARTLCARLAHHLDLRGVRRGRALAPEAARAFGGPDFECDRNCRQPVGRESSKIFRAPPRMSASAMRRATACLRHCSRLKVIPRRHGPSKGRSAGPAPWGRARSWALDGRSRQDLGDREEHLQALSGGHRVSCRDRRLLQFAGEAGPAHR